MSGNRESRVAVLAGSHDEYTQWLHEQGVDPDGYQFVGEGQAAEGSRFHDYIIIGTARLNKDHARALATTRRNVALTAPKGIWKDTPPPK